MVFKSEKELERFLMQKCEIALIKTRDRIYDILNNFVREFYYDYSPEMYERTYQLYRSLVKSRIIPTGNGYSAQVYFDIGSLYYVTGNKPTGEEVMAAASKGWHGAVSSDDTLFKSVLGNTGVGIWDDPMKIIDADGIRMLKNALIEEGIPLKY